jgi:hypothetical protein
VGACARTGDKFFERLQSRINACQRNYHKGLKELQHPGSPRRLAGTRPQPATN